MEGLQFRAEMHPFGEQGGLATTALRVQELLNYTSVDPMVQRKLSAAQRRQIAAYLQEKELDHMFFGPVTLSLRDAGAVIAKDGRWIVRPGAKLGILDGQHRMMALSFVNESIAKEQRRLDKRHLQLLIAMKQQPEHTGLAEEWHLLQAHKSELEVRRLALLETSLSAQIYVGLNEEQEQQLFGDINSKVLLINKELGRYYDNTDPLNNIVKQLAEHHIMLKAAGVEKRSALTAYNKNFTSITWMYSAASILLSGSPTPSHVLERRIRHERAVVMEYLHRYYHDLLSALPEQPGRAEYVCSSRLVQESLALFAYEYRQHEEAGTNEAGASTAADEESSGQRFWALCQLRDFDWTHDNERLAEVLGRLDNGKLNLSYDKTMVKQQALLPVWRAWGDAQQSGKAHNTAGNQ